MRNAAELYKMEQLRGMVEGKSPKELLLLTFSKIIDNLKKIDDAIEHSKLETKHTLVNKTHDIITVGLMASLNKQVNEQLVNSLLNFYSESIKRLTYINLSNNRELLARLSIDFTELKHCFEKC